MTVGAHSGQAHVIAAGEIECAVLPEVGARLHNLRAFGHELLRVPDRNSKHVEEPFLWGAYTMAPWCNRLTVGPTPVGGRLVDLHPNFDDGTAIHGQVYARPWSVLSATAFTITGDGNGWPWPYEVAAAFDISGNSLRIEQRLTNLADEPMPGGIGLHPWFTKPVEIEIAADHVYRNNASSAMRSAPVEGPVDMRQRSVMADDLDETWPDPADPAVRMWWPRNGVTATIRLESPAPHITAASPAWCDAIAVEPQTHAPEGLRRLLEGFPGAMRWIEPGDTLRQVMTFNFERDTPTEGVTA
jgi:aldose 1-epimerase